MEALKQKLEDLIQQEKDAKNKAIQLRFEIESIKEKIQIPSIKEKFEGKYWKFENSYDGKPWWVYSHCIEVKSHTVAIFNSFECDEDGTWEFEVLKEHGLYRCQEEITKEEYNKALNNCKSEFMKLYVIPLSTVDPDQYDIEWAKEQISSRPGPKTK
jgi:hypothetical protein